MFVVLFSYLYVLLFYEPAMTTTKLPFVGWLHLFVCFQSIFWGIGVILFTLYFVRRTRHKFCKRATGAMAISVKWCLYELFITRNWFLLTAECVHDGNKWEGLAGWFQELSVSPYDWMCAWRQQVEGTSCIFPGAVSFALRLNVCMTAPSERD